jgi:hypothetical protein
MEVDDHTNSNHANNIDGDEHQSNHLNFETANSTNTNTNTNTSSVPSRNNSRVSNLMKEILII